MADQKLTDLTADLAPTTDDVVYTINDPGGTPADRKVTIGALLAICGYPCQGRLTTESGVPVSTTDRTAQSTIYFTPYNGNVVALYTGSAWKLYAFTERSLALSALTSGKNYDVFLYDNAGTLTLELSAAWTNDTTRADAITTQDGIDVKSAATSRRLVGTIRTTGTTTTEDSAGGTTTQVGGKRFVWNRYNQARRAMQVIDKSANWSYNTATMRQANAASGNKVEWVTGRADTFVEACAHAIASCVSMPNPAQVGVGIDSITAASGLVGYIYEGFSTGSGSNAMGLYQGCPGLGYHYAAWLEQGAGGGTQTWISDLSVNFSGLQLMLAT